ncbi:ATP-binding protein [Anabaena sp. PCC 7108]|uniref:ATP-binding protein n=1 Tax=Anabaena sp. PCC 7108 TaxID=163908 RepID=UPI000347BD58|nr:ATP-binding protein [Anabaena sp. PCC 7108]
MYLTETLRSKSPGNRQLGGLILLIIAGFLGNYFRWTLFFDIDFLFGSIAVWIVVCLYGVRWGTLAGFIAGTCTYVIWHHPYTTLTFTAEALFVGWLFHRRQQDNIVLLDAAFWLMIGMPLIWLFYAIVLHVDPTQARIILFKQPTNAIFNALIANLLLTHLPIHRWVNRQPAISTLSLQQTLFNLLVAFVSVPTLILIVLASNQVVNDIKNTARLDLNDASRYLTVEVRGWYERRLASVNGLAELAMLNSYQSNVLQQNAAFVSRTFPEFRHIHILDETGKPILDFENNVSASESAFNEDKYFQQMQRLPQPFLSPVLLLPGKSAFPVVLLGVPILRDTKLMGAVFTEIDLSNITNLLQSNLGEEKLDITLVDQKQTVAASTKPELIGNHIFNWRKDGRVEQIGTQTYHWRPTTGSPVVMVQWQNSLFVKESVISEIIPWRLIVQMTAISHVRQIEWFHTRNMAILLFVSGVALISATLVSRQLVKPLSQLAEVTTNLPNKLLEQKPINWMQSQVSELALLLQNFRLMAASLQQKFGEINQANELLEQRVQKRTQALQQTNLELEMEIAERKRVEKDRDRLVAILEASMDYIGMADPQGNNLWNNTSLKNLANSFSEDYSTLRLTHYHPQWALEIIQNHGIPAAIKDGTWVGETALLTGEGEEIPVSQMIISHKTTDGTLEYLSTIMRDISEVKRREAELRSAETTLQSLVIGTATVTGQDFFPALVCHIAEALHVSYALVTELVNGELKALAFWADGALQPSISYFPARTPCELALRDGLFYCETLIQQMFPEDLALVAMQADSYLGISLKNANGDPIGNLCILDFQPLPDTARIKTILEVFAARAGAELERQRAIEALYQLNESLENRVQQRTAQLETANKALESFSYSVSHDLRAPLRAIDGFSRIIQEEYSQQLNAEANRYLKVVRDNAKRMGELIDDLLNLSRLDRQEISTQPVLVNELIQQVLSDLTPELSGRQIEFAIADLPICQADFSLLTQVWINLLSNAIKYTSYKSIAHIQIGYEVIDGEGVYFISDNGSGFDMQYANNLFGVFQRLHREQEFEGTGIGLAIVQRIIQRHGGRIWVKAAVDQGATFYFNLPSSE